jgi:hypothetical protein
MMTRLYAYYIPIWTVVSLAIVLYILVGIKIHRSKVLLSSLQATPSTSALSPSSSSRTFSHHVTYSPFPLPDPQCTETTISTVTISASPNPSKYSVFRSIFSSFRYLFVESTHLSPSDRTSLAYSRVAFLFLASNLITWVPASINRVHAIHHPDTPSFSLNVLAAIVLPLQGLWNCVIYLVVNKSMIRGFLGEWKGMVGVLKERCGGNVRGVEDLGQSVESIEMDDDKMQDLREVLDYI